MVSRAATERPTTRESTGLDRVAFGHSAEMMVLTLVWRADGRGHRRDVVVRLRPPPPALLSPTTCSGSSASYEPSEGTDVRMPRALWMEPNRATSSDGRSS